MYNQTVYVKRESHIDVLRILAMLFIVIGHFCVHYLEASSSNLAGFDPNDISRLTEFISIELIMAITCTGVNIFVLISGYFLITRTELRLKGICTISFQSMFYSILLYMIFVFFEKSPFSTIQLLNKFNPIPSDYWFVQKYLGLMLIAPFLSFLATSLNKRNYSILLIVLGVLFFRKPYGIYFTEFGMTFQWFCFLYLLGGWFRLYGVPYWLKSHSVKFIIILPVVMTTYVFIKGFIRITEGRGCIKLEHFANNSLTLFLAMAFFAYFLLHPQLSQNCKGILKTTPYLFGVYLIHDNSLMRHLIWNELMPAHLPYLPTIVWVILISVFIFSLCLTLDYLRSKLFLVMRVNVAIEKLVAYIEPVARIKLLNTHSK